MPAGSPSANAVLTQACPLGKVGKGKLGIPRPDNAAFSFSPSASTRGKLRPREGTARTQTWTSGCPSCPLSAHLGPRSSGLKRCGARRSVGAGRQAFQKPEACARGRPDPPLWPLSVSLSQGQPCIKEAFAIIIFFSPI